MILRIQNPVVCELARELARLRRTDVTEALRHALRSELERERAKRPLVERLEELANETLAMAGANPRMVTKEEIDDLWGQ
jgi:antitoxin VapB